MLTGMILFASIASAECLEILESSVKAGCIDSPVVVESAAGQTQIYTCEVEPDLYDVVAIFSYDPDVTEIISLEPEICAGGSLYVRPVIGEVDLLRAWTNYMDARD